MDRIADMVGKDLCLVVVCMRCPRQGALRVDTLRRKKPWVEVISDVQFVCSNCGSRDLTIHVWSEKTMRGWKRAELIRL